MRYLHVIVCLLITVADASAADIYSLIQSGKIGQARQELEALSRDSARTGNALYFAALVETDGRKSAALLEDALRNSPADTYREDITLRLARYFSVKGEFSRVASILSAAKSSSFASMRLNALAAEKSGSAEDLLAKLESSKKLSTDQKQWLAIDGARLSLAAGKRKAALASLQTLAGSKNKQIVPQALYLLCAWAVDAGKIDDAARWYNLLNDQFPQAIGLDKLVDKLGSAESEPAADTRAEKATGTFYSVKVGVFSSADNAAQQAARFSGLKLKVETAKKSVGGKPYRIVYVGRYSTFDAADLARQELESKFGEQYQVVAR